MVYSHSPIEEYKLSFRKMPATNGEVLNNHIDSRAKHNQRDGGHGLGGSGSSSNWHRASRYDWRDLVLPALPRSHELEQQMSYMIKNLEQDQTYEAEIVSR